MHNNVLFKYFPFVQEAKTLALFWLNFHCTVETFS